MPRTLSSRLREGFVIVVSAPLVGILMGGIYSVPAMRIAKGRDLWLMLLLASGLSLTVFGIGIVVGASWGQLTLVLALAILGLVSMRTLFGSMDRSVERFGVVHLATLLMLLFVIIGGKVRARP
jgi:hypothetical protein